MIELLDKLDRRIIYLVIGIVVAYPLIVHPVMPIRVSEEVKRAYEFVEDSLPSGSVILISIDYDAASEPELTPMFRAVLTHAFRKGHKVIYMGHWALGLPLAQKDLEEIAHRMGKTYGVDYVNLGYRPGFVTVMLAMGRELRDIYSSDYQGIPIDSIPMMANIHNYDQIDLIIGFEAGSTGEFWIQYVGSRFNKRMFFGTTGVVAPDLYPYYASGQILGLIGGLKGAAEYETQIGHPARGVFGMPAQSFAHLAILIFIVIGNIGYILRRRR
ncbi:hypothetical protein DRP53_05105 [candidate division WOR-3 bacterium]|uniref:Uncharacterized protein n=1 Tax=candidate division WOR-3 bacterium TaxID=2052148 RepID=A0A660SHW0_UNCW3|nr:MAG: hypothetical protein DRP53_05105 [candidate division WOR-3 bacterium]